MYTIHTRQAKEKQKIHKFYRYTAHGFIFSKYFGKNERNSTQRNNHVRELQKSKNDLDNNRHNI